MLLYNGAAIYDVNQNQYVKVHRLAVETVKNIVVTLKSHDVSCLMYELSDNELISYYESLEHKPIYDFVKDRTERYNSTFSLVNDIADKTSEHIMYFTLIDTYNRIKPVYDALRSMPNIKMALVDDTSINGLWWLEIFSDNASKENAVIFLRKTYDYKKVIGFGDNYNDLPMFKACDVSVAVRNALDEVKIAADYICESHDEDGVIKWIEQHVL